MRGQERLGGREREQRLALRVEHVLGDVLHEPADDVRVQDVADHAADGDGAEADEQPLAQLVQVLDERRLLAVVEPARQARARQPQREGAAAGAGQRRRAERAARRAGRLLRGRRAGRRAAAGSRAGRRAGGSRIRPGRRSCALPPSPLRRCAWSSASAALSARRARDRRMRNAVGVTRSAAAACLSLRPSWPTSSSASRCRGSSEASARSTSRLSRAASMRSSSRAYSSSSSGRSPSERSSTSRSR